VVIALVGALLAVLGAGAAHAVTFYVSPDGRDSCPGTSSQCPWRTLARVSQGPSEARPEYPPGSSVLLRGGRRFPGELVLTPRNHAARAGAP
jgi:hypothetical protein